MTSSKRGSMWARNDINIHEVNALPRVGSSSAAAARLAPGWLLLLQAASLTGCFLHVANTHVSADPLGPGTPFSLRYATQHCQANLHAPYVSLNTHWILHVLGFACLAYNDVDRVSEWSVVCDLSGGRVCVQP